MDISPQTPRLFLPYITEHFSGDRLHPWKSGPVCPRQRHAFLLMAIEHGGASAIDGHAGQTGDTR